MNRKKTHFRDRLMSNKQRTVVAVCGVKARVESTVWHIGGGELLEGHAPMHEASPTPTCVGCRAIIAERLQEDIREAEKGKRSPQAKARLEYFRAALVKVSRGPLDSFPLHS